MSNYPPPPQADQQHYNALYPTSAGAQQQLLDPAQQEQLQFSNLNQPIYPKVESNGQVHPHSPSGHHIHELQHHHVLEEQRHHLQHAQQQIQQPTPVASHPASNAAQSLPPTQTSTPEQPQKTNRLRKACDSCSIRKVKVSRRRDSFEASRAMRPELNADALLNSVTRLAHRAGHAPPSTFLAHLIDPADGADLPIDTLKRLSVAVWRPRVQARQVCPEIPRHHHQLMPHKH